MLPTVTLPAHSPAVSQVLEQVPPEQVSQPCVGSTTHPIEPGTEPQARHAVVDIETGLHTLSAAQSSELPHPPLLHAVPPTLQA